MSAWAKLALYGAPLCPAGHLPLKWGDWPSLRLSQIFGVAEMSGAPTRLISPLEGEMSGRTEGAPQNSAVTASPRKTSFEFESKHRSERGSPHR
ncbi:hypothetical protein EN829_020390 [Mesorhizobium sp. M00.F.Ca.ET.186.01.1.1]|nr:hypothetical protein EN848_28965 [bacterium M00.F.Ca.ET.205.01.1.1]TGU50382.1 hypothetical protein EN795_22435 [bacterium M00.F.Ca.ET.152.01.1.1]TGV33857.1 hypothetical protein EN829_020390 [Mesorhizobium sp. M00.F.Ca.ET.186.01.1.1]TGZ40746.1 hypothetical protein EN805_21830 [bacterium M00.F.Ca.ET.162.01.1.1]